MKKLFLTYLVMVFSAVTFLSGVSFGQENSELYYSYGVVIAASGESVTVEETSYNEDTGEEIVEEVTYTIAPDGEVENVESIAAIAVGSEVGIEYSLKEGDKEISYISVYTDEE